jgi:hypothetical protein
MEETIWFNDPAILFAQDEWSRFVPTKNMTVPEALNAALRFTIYFSVLLFLSTSRGAYLLSIPIVMVFTVLLYKLFPDGNTIESFVTKHTSVEHTRPTPDNPFMNVLLTEILDNPERPEAADVTHTDVKNEMYKTFQHTSDIYMDTSDLFDMSTAMRGFHTAAGSTTVPGDLDKFKSWLKKGQDYPDYSSAPPSRNAKRDSESHLVAKGSMRLPSSTAKPKGTTPSHLK